MNPTVVSRFRWKALAFAVFCSFVASVAFAARALWRPSAQGPAPSFRIDQESQSLGLKYPDEPMTVRYRITNVSRSVLNITGLKTSCGCSPARIDKTEVQKGDTATITVETRAWGMPGPFVRQIYFHTNDRQRSDVVLAFQAVSRWPVDFTPANLHTGVILQRTESIQELELYTPNAEAFEVLSIQPSASWVRVEPLDRPSAHRYRYRIRVEAGERMGAFSERIRFETTAQVRSAMSIPVTGEFAASQRVTPRVVVLSAVKAGETRVARLFVRLEEKGTIGDVAVADPSWSAVDWRTKAVGDRTLLEVDLRVPSAPGYRNTVLHIREAMRKTSIDVPVSCLVTESNYEASR